MSFDLKNCYGYGDGIFHFNDVDVTENEVVENFNSYAPVAEIQNNLLTIDLENAMLGQFENFVAGKTILIHASAAIDFDNAEKLGKFVVAKIEVADGGNLTLDKNISETFSADDLQIYKIQAVTFANFHCLKIFEGGIVKPAAYSSTKFCGGILALKCSESLRMLGGHILLNDCGIAPYQKNILRPLTSQEKIGTLDADEKAGEENFCDENIFPLNSGDGAAFIFAKEIVQSKSASRIGNIYTHGRSRCRGASDSEYKPAAVTNVGGSSILIATENLDCKPELFAKYREERVSDAEQGKGLARCYIATRNLLPADDKLFHADLISDSARISRDFLIKDFGSGKHGDCEDPTFYVNGITLFKKLGDAKATAVDEFENNPLAAFEVGTKCYGECLNELTILKRDGDIFTFSSPLPLVFCQLITIAEFENFTLTENYDKNFFAIKVKNKCKITGKISGVSYIFADTLEVGENAWLGDKVFLVYRQAFGLSDKNLPKNALVFQV